MKQMAKLTREEIKQIVNSGRKKGKTPDLSRAKLSQAEFQGIDLSGVDLTGATLTKANLSEANLTEAKLSRADLSYADLSRADMSGADMRGAKLIKANLSGANLFEVNLSRANFEAACLKESHLVFANFTLTNLYKTDFSQAKIHYTTFGDVDLSVAKGLDTIQHQGPSTIGTNTLLLSKGQIPEIFLRGAGLSDTFISYITSLTNTAIQYYSCFISYSSKDEAFAQRLYADLQQKNVRCWFAPEDIKIGDKIRFAIDQSIQLHDKLLLILSENSLNSFWVESEVEKAFEKERQRNTTVLFPVRLDMAVMKTDQPWAAEIRRTRHIGDFTRWKGHDAYQQALERLLRDLKAEG